MKPTNLVPVVMNLSLEEDEKDDGADEHGQPIILRRLYGKARLRFNDDVRGALVTNMDYARFGCPQRIDMESDLGALILGAIVAMEPRANPFSIRCQEFGVHAVHDGGRGLDIEYRVY